MFWKFELHPSTAIDSILSKEDCTLIEILEEDDVLQETKSQNRKLINFFIKPEILEELVSLVITEPDEDFDEKLRYKHPNTACEVLTSDVYTIIDKLSSSEELLNKLWSFLEADPPLNPLLASFFSKVLGVLISRKTSLMLDYLRTKEDFVSLLSKHLGTSAIMDLLLRLITSVESPQLRLDLLEWLNEQQLIEALVALIDPEIDEDRNSNAAQALSDIIRLSRDLQSQMQEGACPDVLLDTIQKRETISSLLDHMFHGIHSHNDSALVNGIFVLLTLLEVKKGPGEGLMTALDAERLAQGVSATLAALTPRLQDFNDLLTDPPLMNPMQTTIGTLDPPLGNARLQIAKLVSSILSTNGDTINKELANLGTVRILWELFFKYPWNNFLHTQVEKCISTILNNPPTEEDGELHTPLVDTLFKDCKCLQKILDAWEDPDPEITHSQARHKGYMGHLTNIANYIVHYREKGRNKDVIESVLNEIPEKDREKWNSFVSGTLAEINKTNTTELVGHHPLQSSSDDDDDGGYKPVPFLPSETSLQHVFSNYQMQQMTADFMDTFGLDGDEFQEPNDGITSQFDRIGDIGFNISANEDNPNSALFDACCNERIQQFDDSGSDEEDVWEEKELTFSSVVENRKSTLSDSDSDSSDSDEDEQGSPLRQSTGSSGSDDDRIVFTDDTSSSPANSPVKKNQPLENTSNKMDIDTGNAWNEFESTEVAMDETVSMDASDVGWDRTPESNPPDTGWANFDNFTDIGMAAASAEQTDKRPDSPVAMETETSPSPPENASPSPSSASAYMIGQDKQDAKEDQSCDDPSKGLVLDTSNVFVNQSSEENVSNDTVRNSSPIKTAPLPPRAANYSCEKEDGVPLASNDSDDDISDDDEGLPAEDARQEISQVENFQLKAEPFNMVIQTPKTTSADTKEAVNENSREEPVATHPSPINTSNSTENPTGNGPVDFHDKPGSQSECSNTSSTNKLEDSTSGISSQSETPPLANGPG